MKTQIFSKPHDVRNRLHGLGLAPEHLTEVIDAMVAARKSCTENHPPGTPGWKAWAEGTCRLREIGAVHDWERNDDGQISCSYDAARGNKFLVCNTDEGTGLIGENQQPQNRSRKGAATTWAVSQNQGSLGGLLDEAMNVIALPADSNGVSYWYLCVFCEGDEVRAELSCPSVCERGYFTAFKERIILIGGDGGDGGVRFRQDAPDDGSLGFEINVTRKQA